jgi:chorismate synthase
MAPASTGRRSTATPSSVPSAARVPELEAYMDALRKSGDSIGAEVTVVAEGCRRGSASRCSIAWMPTSPMP